MRVSFILAIAIFALAISVPAHAQGDAAKGAAVYAAQKCATCHALDGKGMAKGPLDGVGKKLTADEIRQWIVNPAEMSKKANATRKPPMRAYAKLPAADLDNLVAFLASKK